MEDNDNTSLLDFLQAHSRATPGAACITYCGETLSYAELDQRSSALAAALCRSGVNKGDRVAILARNSVAFYELIFACAKTSAIMLPINWRLSGREIAGIMNDGEPVVVLVDPDLEHLLVASAASVITLDNAYDRWRDAPGDEYSPGRHSSAGDTLLLLYTSGTTGIPKGVMICHDNLLYSARMAREIWHFNSNSVNLVAMPLFHIGGIGYGMMALTQGGHTILLQQPVPADLLTAIEQYDVTHAFFVPAVIQSLVDSDGVDGMALSSLELIVYGASPISETLLLRAMEVLGCGFTHAYGLTETSGTVITLPPEAHDPGGRHVARLKSCGQPLPWVEAALFDPETNEAVPVGEVGEIWIRSGMNMVGYWGKPADTAATLRPDNWLRTGDAAYCDEDGYFYIHDRFKDMIVSGGENIYPTEIENVLYEHSAVAETAVIGVPHSRWGETPKAIVVTGAGKQASERELIDFLRERLAHYKCPTSVEFVDALPRSASGKILKRELRLLEWPTRDSNP